MSVLLRGSVASSLKRCHLGQGKNGMRKAASDNFYPCRPLTAGCVESDSPPAMPAPISPIRGLCRGRQLGSQRTAHETTLTSNTKCRVWGPPGLPSVLIICWNSLLWLRLLTSKEHRLKSVQGRGLWAECRRAPSAWSPLVPLGGDGARLFSQHH